MQTRDETKGVVKAKRERRGRGLINTIGTKSDDKG